MHDFVDTLPQAVLDLADHPGIDDRDDRIGLARPPSAMGRGYLVSPFAAGGNAPSSARRRSAGDAPY